jgi:hypothetical protein
MIINHAYQPACCSHYFALHSINIPRMSTGSRDGSDDEGKGEDDAGVNYYEIDHNYKYNYGDDYDDDSSAYGKSATKETEVIEISSDSSNASSSYVGFIPPTRKKSIPQAISQHNRHGKTLHASVKTPSGMLIYVWCACTMSLYILKLVLFEYTSKEAPWH